MEPITPTQRDEPSAQPVSEPVQTPVSVTQPMQVHPPAQSNVVMGEVSTSSPAANHKKGVKRKKQAWIAVVSAALMVALLGGGYVFGVYLPSQPENLFGAALTNTGKGYEGVVDHLSDAKLDTYKGMKQTANFSIKADGVATDGNIAINTDDKNMKLTGTVGVAGSRMSIDVLAQKYNDTNYYDAYVKVGGIKGLGSMAGLPQLDALDGQWIMVDHTLFASLESSYIGGEDSMKAPTAADVMDAISSNAVVTQKYIFSDDPANAVLEQREVIGKETVDGRSLYHYKVAINKENAKEYVTKSAEALDKSKLGVWYKESADEPLSKRLDTEGMIKSIDGVKDTDTFDLWVDTETKLIYKIRVYDDKDYMDVGLDYENGDEIPFFVAIKSPNSSKSDSNLRMTFNKKNNSVDAQLSIKGADSNTGDMTLDFALEPSNEPVSITAPQDAKTLFEVMNSLGLGGMMTPDGGINPQILPQVPTISI